MISLPFWDCCVKKKLFSILLLGLILGKASPYKYYYLERDCLHGSLNISMPSSGPQSSGVLQATSHTSYSLQMSCRIRLIAPDKHYVLVSIREIGFRMSLQGSCIDYLEIEDALCKPMRRLEEEHHYVSDEKKPPNVMNLYYHTSSGLDNKTLTGLPGFILTFTAIQKASDLEDDCGNGGNKSERFSCKNGFCIWSGLACDGHNNCGDLSDEDVLGKSKCGGGSSGSTVLIILAVVIVFLLVIMCSATLLCTKNETVRRFSKSIRTRTLSFLPGRAPSK